MKKRQQIRQNHTVIRRIIRNAGNFRQQAGAVPFDQGIHNLFDVPLVNGAEHVADIRCRQLLVTKRDGLVGQAERIPHTAVRRPGQQPQGRLLERNAFGSEHMGQMTGNVLRRHALQVELQTPGQNRHRQLLGIGRRQQEFDVIGRLLKGFEERVERLIGEHVHLVNEVHLVTTAGGRVLNVVRQLPHIIDARSGGCIDLDQIDETPFLDFLTAGALAAGMRGDAGLTVEATGEQPADGGFTNPTGTGEQIGVVQSLVFEGVDQCLKHVFLTHHVFEGAGTPFTGKYLVAHVPSTAVKMGLTLAWTRFDKKQR